MWRVTTWKNRWSESGITQEFLSEGLLAISWVSFSRSNFDTPLRECFWRSNTRILYNGPFPPQNCLFPLGIWTPSNTSFLGHIWFQNPNDISIGSAVLAGFTAGRPIRYNGPPISPKLPIPMRIWTRSNNGFLGPPESSTQTVSQRLCILYRTLRCYINTALLLL